ncbi:MAG: tripartite tricarboxylate transporter substrate binding protein [Betaproteobacteria bacterium]|nr:tripartite tricarboxylate transporter substrate binding protein [Betaproteobacteria bacterium]
MGPVQGALAQAYPSKPITMVVPYAPGGGADIVSRTISQRLSEGLGQQIIIDNRPGAGGNLGAALAAKAAPDGYTLMLGTNTHAANMSLYAKPPYDLARDFAAVSLLSSTPLVLIVHPSLPASSVKALVALARKKPGELNYSSGGNGSTPHLSAEMFKTAARVDVVHVPYKGVAQGLTDLVSGQVQLMFTSISAATPHIRSGRLRVLAVTGAKRSRAAPEVPTMIESGFRGFEVSIWNALFVPAKTPAAAISRLNAEVVKVLNAADVRERFASLGVEPISSTPEEMEAYVKAELARWSKVVKDSGARVD